ncbi:hypothetical protein GCM10029992_56490 [Glycomyces albus]
MDFPEALDAYVYGEDHRPILQRRREFFEHLKEAYAAMWWVPVGHEPTLREAEEKLALLREQGPTPKAFTMKERFDPPNAVEASS